jgi:AMP-binding enzyme
VNGEILARGPNVTPGYWNNPDAIAAAFDDDGWFRSADVGYLDTDGYLYIVNRLKDVIISGCDTKTRLLHLPAASYGDGAHAGSTQHCRSRPKLQRHSSTSRKCVPCS